jgi:hypothetical protein
MVAAWKGDISKRPLFLSQLGSAVLRLRWLQIGSLSPAPSFSVAVRSQDKPKRTFRLWTTQVLESLQFRFA